MKKAIIVSFFIFVVISNSLAGSVWLSSYTVQKGNSVYVYWNGFTGNVNIGVWKGSTFTGVYALTNVSGADGNQLLDTGADPVWEVRNDYKIGVELRSAPYTWTFSATLSVTSPPNNPPNKPTIWGPSTGNVNISYNFTTSTTDPEDDPIEYRFDFDDGNFSSWSSSHGTSHSYSSIGAYNVRSQARDSHGAESVWSDPSVINIIPLGNEEPTVYIDSGPSGTINTNQATFTWHGTDSDGSVVGYYYSLDTYPPNIWTTGTSHTFTNIPDGGHTFYVKAQDDDGAQSGVMARSFTVETTQVPGIPTGLAITQIAGGFRLTWNSVNGATIYKIYWGTDNSVSEVNYSGILSTNDLIYDHTGLVNGFTYYYRIKAGNSAGYSALSGIVSKQYGSSPSVNPVVSVTVTPIHQGESILEQGSGFTPGGLAELHVVHPNGFHWGINGDKTAQIYSNGCFSVMWQTDHTSPIGTYRYWAIDRTSGEQALEITFEIIQGGSNVGSIAGGISDDIDRIAITNATVYLKSGSQLIRPPQEVNPISAQYLFENLSVGTYEVEAQAPGYVNKSRTIQVYAGSPVQGNITLKRIGSGEDNQAEFISKTLQDGYTLNPGVSFYQKFTFKNIGGNTWRYFTLKKIDGNSMGAGDYISVPQTLPSESCTIKLNMTAPSSGGNYQSRWQLCTSENELFGPVVTVNIEVNAQPIADGVSFIRYEGAGENEELYPDQSSIRAWIFNNSGSTTWHNFTFEKVGGDNFDSYPNQQIIPDTEPGENCRIAVAFIAPSTPGTYTNYWRIKKSSGVYVGDTYSIKIKVVAQNEQTTSENNGTNAESNPNGASSSEPVNLANGNYYYEHSDLIIEGSFGVAFKRTYNVMDNYDGPLGHNWTHNFNTILVPSENGPSLMRTGDGRATYFTKLSDYDFESISRIYEALERNTNDTYTYTNKDGSKQHFSSTGYLIKKEDRNGLTTVCSYDELGRLNKITDYAGRSIQLSYDGYDRISMITDGLRSVHYEYDENGDLVTVADVLGNITTFIYEDHRIIKIIDPKENIVVENIYDENGRCIKQYDALVNQTRFEYDIEHGKTTEIDPRGYRTEYYFEGANRLTGVIDPFGYSEIYIYDANDNRIIVTDKKGNITNYEYNEFGQVKKKIDANGFETVNEYDSRGNLLVSRDDIGNIRSLTYNEYGLPVTIKDGKNAITNLSYDNLGNLVEKEIDGDVTRFVYDMIGRRISSTDPMGFTSYRAYDLLSHIIEETDERGYSSAFEYDENGNLNSETDPKNNTTFYYYSPKDELIRTLDVLGNNTEYTYDQVGNQISITDALGNVTQSVYDGSNQLIRKTDPIGNITTYEYDGNGNRISITNARGNKTLYDFDKMNRMIKITDPLGNITTHTYDGRGRLIQLTDANGHQRQFQYDGAGNLISETDALSNETQYVYDDRDNQIASINPMGGKSTKSYNAKNQLIASADFTGKTEFYEYDAVGNMVGRTDYMGYKMSHEYDENNNKISETDAEGVKTIFNYTENNLLNSISDGLGNIVVNTYDPLGRKIQTTDPNGNSTLYDYDAIGRLTQVTDVKGGITQYTYDPVGNMTLITDANGHQTRFIYDVLNRKIKEVTALGYETKYTYDAINKTNETTPKGQIITFTYYDNNQLKQVNYPDNVITYTYNANGVPIEIKDNSGTIMREYDSENRLLQEFGPNGFVKYTYTGPDRTTLVYPDGKIIEYNYNNHRLSSIVDWDGRITEFEYTPAGFQQKVSYPNNTGIKYTYDGANRLKSVVNFGPNDVILASFVYELDAAGNRTSMIRQNAKPLTIENISIEANRYQLAANLSQNIHSDGSEHIMLMSGFAPPSILTVASLLVKTNWPVLFCDPHNLDRSPETKIEIERLSNGQTDPLVTILDGIYSVSDIIDAQLTELAVKSNRITAIDRFEMAAKIASLHRTSIAEGVQTDSHFVDYSIIVNGLNEQSLLASVPFSAKFGIPILLVKDGEIPDHTKEALFQLGIKHTILVGNDLGQDIKTWLNINGYQVASSFEATEAVDNQIDLWNFVEYSDFDTVYFINQTNITDVLVSSVYAAMKGGVLLLTDNNELSMRTQQFLTQNSQTISHICTISGSQSSLRDLVSEIQSAISSTDTVNYEYDNLNQLTLESYGNGEFIRYVYDAAGNRLGKITNNGTIAYTYDAENRMQTAGNISFTFDANGNRITKTEGNNVTQYNYNDQNRLISVQLPNNISNNFTYDAVNRRIRKIDSMGTHDYIYDMDDLAIEKNELDVIQNYFVSSLGVDDWLYSINNDTSRFYQKDGLSSVIGFSDSTGRTENTIVYDGYGNLKNDINEIINSISFTGRELDRDIELYYYRSRYYDFIFGIFLNQDIYSGTTIHPLILHKYCYVENNPINNVDPFGLCKENVTIEIHSEEWEQLNQLIFEEEQRYLTNRIYVFEGVAWAALLSEAGIILYYSAPITIPIMAKIASEYPNIYKLLFTAEGLNQTKGIITRTLDLGQSTLDFMLENWEEGSFYDTERITTPEFIPPP